MSPSLLGRLYAGANSQEPGNALFREAAEAIQELQGVRKPRTHDPLVLSSNIMGWRCYWDPEGPYGEGKTQEAAVMDLMYQCEDDAIIKLFAKAVLGGIKEI